jgi:iron complex outermembrane receptor protein
MAMRGVRITDSMSALLLTSLLAVAAPLPAAAQEVHAFNVVAADPASAIHSFGVQAGIQILASADDLKGKKLNPVSGKISTEQALNDLLAGTGLDHRYVGDRAVALVRNVPEFGDAAQPSHDSASAALPSKNDPRILIAQAEEKPPAKESGKDQQTVKNPAKPVEKVAQLEEIIVTGSRIPTHARESAQEVKIYTREQIERSGQVSVADFLNTLPSVSSQSSIDQGFLAATTVRLHGLAQGTTLVLLNGRRVEGSGTQQGAFFDLENLPISAVDRIEVVPVGTSAIYGSDAIAGVVNVILKKDFDGLESNVKYGAGADIHQYSAEAAWGHRWNGASLSILGTYEDGSTLIVADRARTANLNYSAFGGLDARSPFCSPGTVFSSNGSPLNGVGASFAAVPPGSSGKPTAQQFVATANTMNLCNGFYAPDTSIIPGTRRTGLLLSGDLDLSARVHLFTEVLVSHNDRTPSRSPIAGVYGVPAGNPFNPFGQDVTVFYAFTSLPESTQGGNTQFTRPLLGIRGDLSGNWHWEAAAWNVREHTSVQYGNFGIDPTALNNALNSTNPATALNLFSAAPPGSPALLTSLPLQNPSFYDVGQTSAANAFIRGPVANLWAGPLETLFGGEYERDALQSEGVFPPFNIFHRNIKAMFAEARIPLIAGRGGVKNGETLALNAAVRYDDYSDFGSKITPQFGAEWRPMDSLLLRGTYGKSFQAPGLVSLYAAPFSYQANFPDPRNNNTQDLVTVFLGGNPHLQPQTGVSRSVGVVYTSTALPGLSASLEHWDIDETNAVQTLQPPALIINESLFPGAVVRGPGQNGQPGPITQINDLPINFGNIKAAGFDADLSYRWDTGFGELTPSISVAEMYHYTAALTPDVAATDRLSQANDDLNWAPRWKGTVALAWKAGAYSMNVTGRYVGRYRDYDPLITTGTYLTLGNFWLVDLNARYVIGQTLAHSSQYLRNSYLEVGAVNLANSLPPYSNIFGVGGYDPTQYDIRGRFLYTRLGVKF